MRVVRSLLLCGAAVAGAAGLWAGIAATQERGLPGAAEFEADGSLPFPSGTDRWIVVGASLGGEYSDAAFDPDRPGPIAVTQLEPEAYDHYLANGEYADGTMFLLTFYRTLENPDPQFPGFAQGEVAQREIHVIDRGRYPDEHRAFFVYSGMSTAAVPPMPPGSACVVCHTEHGEFDGTFRQFYPALRDRD